MSSKKVLQPTSLAAKPSVPKIRESQNTILKSFKKKKRMTDTQLIEYLGYKGVVISPSGARTRRSELVKLGLIVDTGKREVLPSGRKSIVWGLA